MIEVRDQRYSPAHLVDTIGENGCGAVRIPPPQGKAHCPAPSCGSHANQQSIAFEGNATTGALDMKWILVAEIQVAFTGLESWRSWKLLKLSELLRDPRSLPGDILED